MPIKKWYKIVSSSDKWTSKTKTKWARKRERVRKIFEKLFFSIKTVSRAGRKSRENWRLKTLRNSFTGQNRRFFTCEFCCSRPESRRSKFGNQKSEPRFLCSRCNFYNLKKNVSFFHKIKQHSIRSHRQKDPRQWEEKRKAKNFDTDRK